MCSVCTIATLVIQEHRSNSNPTFIQADEARQRRNAEEEAPYLSLTEPMPKRNAEEEATYLSLTEPMPKPAPKQPPKPSDNTLLPLGRCPGCCICICSHSLHSAPQEGPSPCSCF